MALTDGKTGLYIPQGWIHMVYTIRGSYLASHTYTNPSQINGFIDTVEKEHVLLEKDEIISHLPAIQFLFKTIATQRQEEGPRSGWSVDKSNWDYQRWDSASGSSAYASCFLD